MKEISLEEVEEALNEMKSGKAGGISGGMVKERCFGSVGLDS